MPENVLRIDSSAAGESSTTQALATELIDRLVTDDSVVTTRRLDATTPLLTPEVTAAFRNPGADHSALSAEGLATIATSDDMIAELRAADVVVVAAPIYNFNVPAALKAWADLVARAQVTFEYTPNGPAGLLEDRPTYIVTSSGGMPIGSAADHGSTWLQGFLGFLGLRTNGIISAEGMASNSEAGLASAREMIAQTQAPAL